MARLIVKYGPKAIRATLAAIDFARSTIAPERFSLRANGRFLEVVPNNRLFIFSGPVLVLDVVGQSILVDEYAHFGKRISGSERYASVQRYIAFVRQESNWA